MNLKNKMIMEEYRKQRTDYLKLSEIVVDLLQNSVKKNDIEVLAVEHRVKTEDSLAGKLELKGEKYFSLSDITDILGARIICFFADDVDKVATLIEKMFEVDWDNSVDKRAQLDPNAFGYLSLHYVCSLPENGIYPEELCGKKFEIQIRSTLQHTWAAINHDLGYKSEFGVPKKIIREFSRIAGLLEIADEEFISIRDNIHLYGDEIRQKIADNQADQVLIDMVSLKEYMKLNKEMRGFLSELAAINKAEIQEISPESYLEQLVWLGKRNLGDLQQMLEENKQLAFALAKYTLDKTDLDILASNVGLRYLCRAELLNKHYPQEKIEDFIALSTGDSKRAVRQAQHLLDVYEKVTGESHAE